MSEKKNDVPASNELKPVGEDPRVKVWLLLLEWMATGRIKIKEPKTPST